MELLGQVSILNILKLYDFKYWETPGSVFSFTPLSLVCVSYCYVSFLTQILKNGFLLRGVHCI